MCYLRLTCVTNYELHGYVNCPAMNVCKFDRQRIRYMFGWSLPINRKLIPVTSSSSLKSFFDLDRGQKGTNFDSHDLLMYSKKGFALKVLCCHKKT